MNGKAKFLKGKPKHVNGKKGVKYDTENNWAVLTQMHGSVWPKVLPFCIGNVLNLLLVKYLKEHNYIDLTFNDKGHTFMSMMVSFLTVTRSNIAYSRFMEGRSHLGLALKSCRELIQLGVTFTRYDKSREAREWRKVLSRRTIVLLRTVVAVLEYQTSKMHAWKAPELTMDEKEKLKDAVGESNERAVFVMAMWTRTTISSQRECLVEPMHINKELRLHHFVSEFITAYHGLMKLITTPFPFPLVQMTRTFLLVWIFTLPWVLMNSTKKLPALILIVFTITYAFVGLEFVSIELDDPYGSDANDFDVLGMAGVVFDDIFTYIFDIDGREAAEELSSPLKSKFALSRQIQYSYLSSSIAYKIADKESYLEELHAIV